LISKVFGIFSLNAYFEFGNLKSAYSTYDLKNLGLSSLHSSAILAKIV